MVKREEELVVVKADLVRSRKAIAVMLSKSGSVLRKEADPNHQQKYIKKHAFAATRWPVKRADSVRPICHTGNGTNAVEPSQKKSLFRRGNCHEIFLNRNRDMLAPYGGCWQLEQALIVIEDLY
jgi:hypothetical protein